MPILVDCAKCGPQTPHGFHIPVAGIMHIYQTLEGVGCSFYEVVENGEQRHDTLAAAWTAIRHRWPRGDSWASAWDARILEGNEEKAQRLFKRWIDSGEVYLKRRRV